MSHSDCAERDRTYITLSCVLFSIVVDSHVSRADVIAYIALFAYFTNPDYRLIRMTSPLN
jgi:hypothetical protein